MDALNNSKPCVGFLRIKNYKIFDAVNVWCDHKNIDHHNDYADKIFLVYFFSLKDAKQVLKWAQNSNLNGCIFVNEMMN